MSNEGLPEDDSEFASLMEEIDEYLRREDVDIPARPLRGASEVAKRLNIEFPLAPGDPDYEPTEYSGLDLSVRIFRWFEARYGDRLQIDLRPGRVVILLRGDPWELTLPRFFGSHKLVSDPSKSTDPVDPNSQPPTEPPTYNVLDSITDLPEGLRSDLSEKECSYVMTAFRAGVENFRLLESVMDKELVPEAMADLESSCHHLLSSKRSPGQSKWASLQLAEKTLKAFIIESGQTPPRSHDLGNIAATAESIGLAKVPEPWIDMVQCDAGVRYGDVAVSVEEAISAQHSAMDIAAHAASFFADELR